MIADEPIRCVVCDLPIIDIGTRSEVFWVHEHNRRRTCPNTIATPPRRPAS